MPKGKCLDLVLSLSSIFLIAPVAAGEHAELDQAIQAVTNTLPSGWTVAKVTTNEIPYGHHWNENYAGPTGTLVIAKGTRPVHAAFIAPNGKSNVVHVATEALEIWLMPSNYSDSRFAWLSIDRPIQPTVVINRGPVKLYAEPSHVLLSEKNFKDLLSNTNGIAWVDSPFDSPQLLTWKDWRLKLRKAMETALAK
jgi:hypothetical protein